LTYHDLVVLYVFRYCPGGPDSDFEYSTQSYTGYEVYLFYYCNFFVKIMANGMMQCQFKYNSPPPLIRPLPTKVTLLIRSDLRWSEIATRSSEVLANINWLGEFFRLLRDFISLIFTLGSAKWTIICLVLWLHLWTPNRKIMMKEENGTINEQIHPKPSILL
jgi:hypothetical protein